MVAVVVVVELLSVVDGLIVCTNNDCIYVRYQINHRNLTFSLCINCTSGETMPPTYKELPQSQGQGQSYGQGHGTSDDNGRDSFELDNFSDLDSLDYEIHPQIQELDYQQEPFQLDDLGDLTNKSNLKMAFMNMANSILGAGAIGTPFAMSNCGVVGGAFGLILLTVLVDFTIRLIVINLKLTGKTTYQDTVDHCFGKRGKFIIILAQALFAFGGSIGFCIIIGDTIPHILRSPFSNYQDHAFLRFVLSRNFIIVLVTVTISLPLSLSKDISNLAKASALALVSMAVIIIIILIRGPQLPAEMKGELHLSSIFVTPRFFQGISVISFALVCHHNTSFIFHSLKNPSLNNFSKLTHASCFVSMCAIALIGFGGFFIFKDQTKGNILNNFPGDDKLVNVARFCFGFNMLTTFPLEIFVLRDVLRDLYYINQPTSPELSRKSHIIFTSILVFTTMGISLTTCNLGALFELVGSTTASVMAYILPPMCNLKITGNAKSNWKKLPYWGCIAFGFLVMFVSSTQTIVNAIRGSDESHCVV